MISKYIINFTVYFLITRTRFVRFENLAPDIPFLLKHATQPTLFLRGKSYISILNLSNAVFKMYKFVLSFCFISLDVRIFVFYNNKSNFVVCACA